MEGNCLDGFAADVFFSSSKNWQNWRRTWIEGCWWENCLTLPRNWQDLHLPSWGRWDCWFLLLLVQLGVIHTRKLTAGTQSNASLEDEEILFHPGWSVQLPAGSFSGEFLVSVSWCVMGVIIAMTTHPWRHSTHSPYIMAACRWEMEIYCLNEDGGSHWRLPAFPGLYISKGCLET